MDCTSIYKKSPNAAKLFREENAHAAKPLILAGFQGAINVWHSSRPGVVAGVRLLNQRGKGTRGVGRGTWGEGRGLRPPKAERGIQFSVYSKTYATF